VFVVVRVSHAAVGLTTTGITTLPEQLAAFFEGVAAILEVLFDCIGGMLDLAGDIEASAGRAGQREQRDLACIYRRRRLHHEPWCLEHVVHRGAYRGRTEKCEACYNGQSDNT
jgi:hypothetical protein